MSRRRWPLRVAVLAGVGIPLAGCENCPDSVRLEQGAWILAEVDNALSVPPEAEGAPAVLEGASLELEYSDASNATWRVTWTIETEIREVSEAHAEGSLCTKPIAEIDTPAVSIVNGSGDVGEQTKIWSRFIYENAGSPTGLSLGTSPPDDDTDPEGPSYLVFVRGE